MRKTLVVIACALLLAGCGGTGGAGKRTLTVLAASSLTGAFTGLASQFEAAHPGTQVKLVFDSSATLAQQADEGAPGDVLATADQRTMHQAQADGGVRGTPVTFASNALVLAVPKDNPAHIGSVGDLAKAGVDYLTCVRTAPCGASAAALLAKAGITRPPASEEVDVKSVVTKVAAGEADAGLVYQTDVNASGGKVTAIAIPGATEDPNTYWVAVTSHASATTLAGQWVRFVAGPAAQATLRKAGFGKP